MLISQTRKFEQKFIQLATIKIFFIVFKKEKIPDKKPL